jgi:hypothetical protein
MDTGNEYFQRVNNVEAEKLWNALQENGDPRIKTLEEAQKEHPNHGATFYVGQNIEIDGSKFRVLTITKKTMTLRLLPK